MNVLNLMQYRRNVCDIMMKHQMFLLIHERASRIVSSDFH